jgi:lantibiotic modifying enzyme
VTSIVCVLIYKMTTIFRDRREKEKEQVLRGDVPQIQTNKNTNKQKHKHGCANIKGTEIKLIERMSRSKSAYTNIHTGIKIKT